GWAVRKGICARQMNQAPARGEDRCCGLAYHSAPGRDPRAFSYDTKYSVRNGPSQPSVKICKNGHDLSWQTKPLQKKGRRWCRRLPYGITVGISFSRQP